MFHYGLGVRKNSELARLWFTRAAKKGDSRAKTVLYCFYSGRRPTPVRQPLSRVRYSQNFRTMYR